jgi:molybdenum cofactor guanylyltransferase
MKQPLGVILAGGQATRIGGGDKGMLPLGRGTILDQVIARLESQVHTLALNANGDASRFSGLGLPVISDSIGGFAGPLSGVLAGLDWAAGKGASHIVTAAADTPFFPCDLVPRLILAAREEGTQIALAHTPDGWQPTFGLWPTALRDDLRSALEAGLRKVVLWAERHGCAAAMFPDAAEFFNINTRDDLVKAESML